MQFVRKKKRGVNRKVARMWFSKEGYRITWRKEAFGIRVPARFKACVRVMVPNYSGEHGTSREVWDFLGKPRLYKTMNAAKEDCERHLQLWTKACEATGVRGLLDVFGKLPVVIPLWARKKLNRKALAILLAPNTNDRAEEDDECPESSSPAGGEPNRSEAAAASPISDANSSSGSPRPGSPPTPTSGPASPAEDGDGTTTPRTRRARSKATAHDEPWNVPLAEEAAAAPAKQSRKRTANSSKRSRPRKPTTTGSSQSTKQRSRGSRSSKSEPSKN